MTLQIPESHILNFVQSLFYPETKLGLEINATGFYVEMSGLSPKSRK